MGGSSSQSIKDSIRMLAKTDDVFYSYPCTVDSVNTTNKTCDCLPLNGDADLLEVRLIADDKTGILITPTVGSVVIVTMINKMTGYVSMFSEVDSIALNGESFDGLVKVKELTTKINTLENDINTLKAAFSSWVTVPNDGGAALKAIAATWYGSSLTPTVQTDIENTTIKHGDGSS